MWLHRLISSAIAATLLLHNHMQDGFPTSSILYASTSLPFELHPNGSTWTYTIIDQVYMGERQHEDPDLVTASHHDMMSSALGSKEEAVSSIVYSYKHGFSGFAAMLTESQADQIADLPEVISVNPSRSVPLHTTRSWDYLGLGYEQPQPTGLLRRGNFGDGIIVGVVDSGKRIWPESRSFDDHGYGPVPSRWKGTCQIGQNFTVNNCNRKIIGARWYPGGVDPSLTEGDYQSPRGSDYHGTHTASTAAGSLVSDASFRGLGAGTARGGAPRARLAIYKACWANEGCPEAAVLKAIDDAIHDGVDILSLSLGGLLQPYFPSIHAVAKGITVIFSGGNEGPVTQTISNDLPWVITGQSILYESTDGGFKELADGGSCSRAVLNSSDVVGKIVLCYQLAFASSSPPRRHFPLAASNVQEAGGKGIIFAQYSASILSFIDDICNGTVCVFVDYEIGKQITDYVTNTRSPLVKVSLTQNMVGSGVMSPRVAAFSSRGPSILFPDLIKPDITAPGFLILAAVKDSYKFDSGTSMSCPHVSGVAALLKAAHPQWSPAAIKSALITTAHTANAYGFPIEAEGVPRKLADPFDFGGGHIDPNKAADPGLIYDVDPEDHVKFFNCIYGPSATCELVDSRLYHLNLPSLSIPDLKKTPLTVWRTVTNVGDTDSIYRAMVESPPGVNMVVEPSLLQFNASTTTHTFAVTFMPLQMVQGDFNFGSLTWFDDGKHTLLYIVYMGERQHEDPDLVTASHHDMMSSALGSKEEAVSSIVYSYKHGFSGFAAMLTESQADQIAGIWPESRGFDDHGYGPVPSRWNGTCEVGQNFTFNHCNRKIIGARWYAGGVDDSDISVDYRSPRDFQGHGTHTASTAAGSFVGNASFHGLGAGVARGGAPRARLAIYKACWESNIRCPDAALLKAIDDAVHDGVDILSLPLGGLLHPIFASMHAVAKGITVIFAGGNDGPVPQTISNDLPWVITVAASTMDRSFPTLLTLGDNRTVVGQSILYESTDGGFKELADGGSCSRAVLNSSDVVGKIVLCYQLAFASSSPPRRHFPLAASNVQEAGGKGIIFAQYSASILHFIDDICNGTVFVFVDYEISKQIKDYPDITAPGFLILATVKDSYKFESGTSMSCPHVSGVAVLLKAANPQWSPAAIKSALLIRPIHTASPLKQREFLESSLILSTLAAVISIRTKPLMPGLFMTSIPKTTSSSSTALTVPSATCDLVDSRLYGLNLPSISIPDLKKTPLTVWRIVTNVGDMDSIYRAMVESPPGVNMVVEASLLQFNASTTTHTFAVTFTPLQMVQGNFNFGSLTWFDDGKHAVRTPIAVRVIIHDSFSDTS
ncbi:Subtilase family [Musa troglodytarum]|uniref:Subtilase family n=1 Tax=Musa troglodytarum TaxID=320322 RepID=A0A9E7FHB1_9LILI|nr:Subtilase family [Musa troglodytarum]